MPTGCPALLSSPAALRVPVWSPQACSPCRCHCRQAPTYDLMDERMGRGVGAAQVGRGAPGWRLWIHAGLQSACCCCCCCCCCCVMHVWQSQRTHRGGRAVAPQPGLTARQQQLRLKPGFPHGGCNAIRALNGGSRRQLTCINELERCLKIRVCFRRRLRSIKQRRTIRATQARCALR